MENLAKRLKWLRLKRGLSQQQLADRAEVSQGTIGNAESGLRQSIREIGAVADVLSTTAQWLQHGKGTPPVIEGDESVQDITPIGEHPVNEGDQKGAKSGTSKTIPTEMPYDPEYLSSTILLLGNLLGALDERSRRSISGLLQDLTEKPDERQDIAARVVANARVSNEAFARIVKGKAKQTKTESQT